MITATACRIFPRRCRPPPTSINSSRPFSSCSPWSFSSTSSTWNVPGRDEGGDRPAIIITKDHFCFAHNRDPRRLRRQHSRRLFSISSSSSSSNDNEPPSIEVTVTNNSETAASSNKPSPSCSDADLSPGTPNLSKSPDQIAEEEILSLQSELRLHHRHAAYSAALSTASRLLDMTSGHFGPVHPATASAHNNVGLMQKMLGKYDEAREAYHESLRVYGEVVGKDHASYAAALSNLGMLERGRVLESEAAEQDDGEDEHDENDPDEGNNVVENEDETDLEKLMDDNKKNEPKSTKKMSALERMQLSESAIEYLDEAYRIRLSELGSDHPHTVASRSQLGSAMAAAVIAERKGRIGGLVESELRSMRRSGDVNDVGEMEARVPEALARAARAATNKGSGRLTRRRWEAAEEHLRGALDTAVREPRGERIGPLTFIPVGGGGASEGDGDGVKVDERRGLTLPPKKETKKEERVRLAKERKREKRRANANALLKATGGYVPGGGRMAVQGAAAKVTTLSAATAAQNLAVFLKNYSDWMRLTTLSSTEDDESDGDDGLQQRQKSAVNVNRTVQEARHLYEAALHVRSSILPGHHPEVVATKFSLAELLDSPRVASASTITAPSVTGNNDEGRLDGGRATALREEILNAYNVEEREEDGTSDNHTAS